jgi:hypothetical protein
MAFNSTTLFLVDMLVLFWAAAASLLTWFHRSRTPGLLSWAVALALSGSGNFVLYHYGARAPFWALATAATANIASFATMWAGLRRFRNPSIPWQRTGQLVVLVSALFLAVYSIAYWQGAAVRAQSAVFLATAIGITLLAAHETWRSADETGLGARRIAAVAIACISGAYSVRLIVMMLLLSDLLAPSLGTVVIDGMRYFSTSCILVATYGLIFVASAQLTRNRPVPSVR